MNPLPLRQGVHLPSAVTGNVAVSREPRSVLRRLAVVLSNPLPMRTSRVYPVLVDGGIPFFPQRERRVDLELVETRTFSSRVVYLHYRVAR